MTSCNGAIVESYRSISEIGYTTEYMGTSNTGSISIKIQMFLTTYNWRLYSALIHGLYWHQNHWHFVLVICTVLIVPYRKVFNSISISIC